jgi:hypothetical protein
MAEAKTRRRVDHLNAERYAVTDKLARPQESRKNREFVRCLNAAGVHAISERAGHCAIGGVRAPIVASL